MKKISIMCVLFTVVFTFGCGGGSSGASGQPGNNNDTSPKPNPPNVSQVPIAITATNAVDLGRRAYFAIIGEYAYSVLNMGNEVYAQKQGQSTEQCMTSGTRTQRWDVANIGNTLRAAGDQISLELNACSDQSSTKTYGAITTTINSSYDARGESGDFTVCTPTCTINQTIDLVDFVTIDAATDIGINGTVTKALTVEDTGAKTLLMSADLFTAGSTTTNEGSQVSNYQASSTYNPNSGEYTGSASLTLDLSTPSGRLDITGSYTSDHDYWQFIQAATATSVNLTITVTGDSSSLTVNGTVNSVSISVDENGDGIADGAPIILSPVEFLTTPAAP